jgi:hypothetical protein
MTTDLRAELIALAETQAFAPDPTAWDRGRRSRRRTRVSRGAAALAVVAVVAGAGALAVRPTATGPAEDVVPDGAIPSVIPQADGDVLTDLAIGRASVAYVDSDSRPVLVDAATGEAHVVELPDFPDAQSFDLYADHRTGTWLALTPDGTRLAYPTTSPVERDPGQFHAQTSWYRTVDLTTGTSELVDLPECGSTPWAMTWTSDGQIAIDTLGRPSFEKQNPGVVSCTVDPSTGDTTSKPLVGVTAPGGGVSATFAGSDVRYADLEDGPPDVDPTVGAVPFVTSSGTDLSHEVPAESYPDGAIVRPIGWADDSLLVAGIGDDVVLLTSPDRPESEWVWRTMVSDVPRSQGGMSVAVDLVPDLTGEPGQELSHDFTASTAAPDNRSGALPYALGGVMALLAGIAFIRMRQKRA